MVNIAVGGVYRLRHDWEIRDERSGTMKGFLPQGQEIRVKRIEQDEDHVWVEGISLPLPLGAFRQGVEPVAQVSAKP
ncbi:MAG TPA: hypothetical protein VD902_16155 [Symbiobacteriaceae bacterium]|nr:hypothetical protein [Symbiobacteriaceae bacterium]